MRGYLVVIMSSSTVPNVLTLGWATMRNAQLPFVVPNVISVFEPRGAQLSFFLSFKLHHYSPTLQCGCPHHTALLGCKF